MSNQFFGQKTLAAQYFRQQYLHGAGGQPEQDGKSGYWRLFYYQLQEAELKKNEQEQGKEAPSGARQVAEEVATVAHPRKSTKRKLEPLVRLETFEKPEFRRKAIYSNPTKLNTKLPALLLAIDNELAQMYKDFAPRIVAQAVKFNKQVDAANDADLRIRLLLLAA